MSTRFYEFSSFLQNLVYIFILGVGVLSELYIHLAHFQVNTCHHAASRGHITCLIKKRQFLQTRI